MRQIVRWWGNVSISKRLYFVVGIMALLIACELLTLRFAMKQLSAARAFVGAEGLWAKAQKNAVFSLQRYGTTRDEKDFQAYLDFLKVPEGDHRARIELLKKNPNLNIVRQGFLDGHVHADDIDPMIELLRRFYWISYLSKDIEIWTKGDELLFRLKEAGTQYREATISRETQRAAFILNEVKGINDDLTLLENDFSFVLGEGSRWLEHMVLSVLTIAVLIVESVGLSLAFFTSRAISKGLNALNEAAYRIGQGDFTNTLPVKSRDEIGQLAEALNKMGELLKQSYSNLEERVRDRTAELAKMVVENARLYEEASRAVQTREEFISIASHELKTPLTSLYLQLQRLARSFTDPAKTLDFQKFEKMATISLAQTKKITVLLDELLDLTRFRAGKLQLHRENANIVSLVEESISQLGAEATRAGSKITLTKEDNVFATVDVVRISQIVTNLLSNAIKYGQGKPIDIAVLNNGGKATVRILDRGIGISEEKQNLLFEMFERGDVDPKISGLGLGLYISQQIARAHGGVISVESATNKGSTFTLSLPKAS